jgi:dienelactone hydrolase
MVSSWTLNGVDVPYVPFLYQPSDFANPPYSLRPVYERSMSNPEVVKQAAIAVEKIGGPVLLLSGEDDQVWDATTLANIVMKRLKKNNFRHFRWHLHYKDAGHLVFLPYQPSGLHHFGPMKVGGTMEGNAASAVASWDKVLCFFKSAAFLP